MDYLKVAVIIIVFAIGCKIEEVIIKKFMKNIEKNC